MLAAVADSLEFERKYTSVVIAWAPDDQLTDAQVRAVLDPCNSVSNSRPGRAKPCGSKSSGSPGR